MSMPDMLWNAVQAMSQSVINTNQQLEFLTQNLHQHSQATYQSVSGMADSLRQNGVGSGSAAGSASGGGVRSLKPKKDMTQITASDARTLMFEIDQFEIDLGEIGVSKQSEEAYRQLRAMSTGKANDVLA